MGWELEVEINVLLGVSWLFSMLKMQFGSNHKFHADRTFLYFGPLGDLNQLPIVIRRPTAALR